MSAHRMTIYIAHFLLVTISADRMSRTSRQTYHSMNSWINSIETKVPDDCIPVLNLLLPHLRHCSLELNACNLFTIRLTLIWTALSIVITYTVVFIELTNAK